MSQNEDNQQGRTPSVVLGDEAVYVETTLSDKTRQHYDLISRRLFHRYLRSVDLPHETPESEVNAEDFACFLLAMIPTWKAATWRMNRQACYRMIMDSNLLGKEAGMSMLKSDATMRSTASIDGRKDSRGSLHGTIKRSTSSLKQKHISEHELKRLLSWLHTRSRSPHAPATGVWLQVGIMTGLRPTEWRDATLISTDKDPNTNEPFPDKGTHGLLVVRCAKNTNGRGFDILRHLDITHFSDESIKLLFRMKKFVDVWREEGTFNENQRSCARLLASACRSLWPHKAYTISLYSARHQAISNWKNAGKSKAEISVLSGHAVTETASENYGRKTGGWRRAPVMPEPITSELDKGVKVELLREQIKKERRNAKTHGNALNSVEKARPAPSRDHS